MATLDIFVSFEFDKDNDLRNNFYEQAKTLCPHRVRNCSLRESYPNQYWENKARIAIAECNVVVVLIGEDTHNAPGVLTETKIAHSLNRPTIQVRPQDRPYKGLTRLGEPITWKWKTINKWLNGIGR